MPDMGITEILTLIGTGLGVAGTGAGLVEQMRARQQAAMLQGQQHRQAQEQSMVARQQQQRAGNPALQTATSGFLVPPSQQTTAAELTGNPGLAAGAPGGGSLTPAIENLFPQGGLPSLTEPWPTNV